VATIGSYGVISYSVAQRSGNWSSYSPWSGEIRHFRVVIGQGLRMDMAGVTVGGTVALLLMRVLSSFSHLLYGVGTNDPTRCVAVSLMLIGVAVLAWYLPARRATPVDPNVAPRYE
jgi:putative ABC transport system permease protein